MLSLANVRKLNKISSNLSDICCRKKHHQVNSANHTSNFPFKQINSNWFRKGNRTAVLPGSSLSENTEQIILWMNNINNTHTQQKWVTEANGRWRGERCGLPLTSLSIPSCKAGVYARCRLKTMGTEVECQLLELWVVKGPTRHWVMCLALLNT